jgi:hypothetical protein
MKNEVKSNKISEEIRSELSLALNNWQDIDSQASKNSNQDKNSGKSSVVPKPQKKTKLLKAIQAQLKSLS